MQFQSYFDSMKKSDSLKEIVLGKQVLGYSFNISFPSYRGSQLILD